MLEHNKFIINNDDDLRNGIKEWYCAFIEKPKEIVFIEFHLTDNFKVERFSANGFNNLLITICALKKRIPHIRIYLHLFTNDLLKKIENDNEELLKDAIKKLLIFMESLNLIDMLLKLGVVIYPSDETLRQLAARLNAFKQERNYKYSSKILCLNPLINNEQEQYNLTYRMKTLLNILYWRLKDRIDFKEVEEASGQIMFELVKNIYQHSGSNNQSLVSGFTCAQINSLPIIKFSDLNKEKKYTESLFLALSQKGSNFQLNTRNLGSFISITVNDFGVGIHKKVMEKKNCLSIEDAIICAFTTNFSSKKMENEVDYWEYSKELSGIKLEHKGFGLLYCLMFVFKNLGRIKICSGNIELKLFSKIEQWAGDYPCKTPVDFLNLLNESKEEYMKYFDVEIDKLNYKDFVGTQILIEIPTDNIYCRSQNE